MDRLTVIKPDNIIIMDGKHVDTDLSFLPENFKALQWNKDSGFIEEVSGKNIRITSLAEYQNMIDAFNAAIQEKENAAAAKLEEQRLYSVSPQGVKERIAERRWQLETGGVAWNDYYIDTSREAQAQLASIYLIKDMLSAGLTFKFKYNKFANITIAQLEDIVKTVRQFVQHCFEQEAAKAALVDSLSAEELASKAGEIVSVWE